MYKILFLFFFPFFLFSETTYLKKIVGSLNISKNFLYYEDKSSELKLENFLKDDIRFSKNLKKNISFGFTNSSYWFYTELNSDVKLENYLIEISNSKEEKFGEERLFEILKKNDSLSVYNQLIHLSDSAKSWLDKSSTLQDDIAIILIDKI